MLIVLEGPEAVGKSTQARLLAGWLQSRGLEVVSLREPGGTSLGDQLRGILLDPGSHLSSRTEALLFMASRAELMEQVVRPALAARKVVLLDRFFLSTYAYQVAGRGLPEGDVQAANRFATGGLIPDLTLLLQLPLDESRRRLGQRSTPDRIEQATRGFHERVAAAFDSFVAEDWQRTHPECGRVVGVDATGNEAAVFSRLKSAVEQAWPGSFATASS